MRSPNDIDAYSRDRYRARQSARSVTRPASKYEDELRDARPIQHDPDSRARAYEQRRKVAVEQAARLQARESYVREQGEPRHKVSYTASASSHSLSNGNVAAFQHRGSKVPIVIGALVVLVIAAAIFFFLNPPFFTVTVNGQQASVNMLTTVQDLIDDGYASPSAGDLIALDGSVAQESAGQPFVATINDSVTSDPSARLKQNAAITIEDGGDLEEAYTETIERIPFEQNAKEPSRTSYYDGSIHVLAEGADGSQSVRTGSVSGKTQAVVLEQPVNEGFTTYTADVGDDKVIALTFDDGPWPTSSRQILDILKKNDAHATFFVIGNQCKDNASVLKEIDAAGNQIGTHTYDHASGSGQGVDLTLMTKEEQLKEVSNGFKAIEEVVGHSVSRVMRAPGGNYYGRLVTNLAPHVTAEIGWDVDTTDWEHPGVDAIVEQLLSVEPGEVVLMHDGGGERAQTVEALSIALPILKQRGYKFITIDELLDYGIASAS